MQRFCLEGLEQRTLLSAVVLDAGATPLQEASVAIVRAAARLANYRCQGQVEGIAGAFVLKLSIVGTRVTGSIYSSSWGGFQTSVAGTLSSGRLSLTGRSTTFVLRSLRASFSSAGLISGATWAVTQVGMQGIGAFKAAKAGTVPVPSPAVAPNVLGTYKGKSYDARGKAQNVTLTITKQSHGLIWGKANGASASGIVLSNGEIHMMIRESDGTTWVTGRYSTSTHKVTGKWSSDGNDGSSQHGTFTLTRQ